MTHNPALHKHTIRHCKVCELTHNFHHTSKKQLKNKFKLMILKNKSARFYLAWGVMELYLLRAAC